MVLKETFVQPEKCSSPAICPYINNKSLWVTTSSLPCNFKDCREKFWELQEENFGKFFFDKHAILMKHSLAAYLCFYENMTIPNGSKNVYQRPHHLFSTKMIVIRWVIWYHLNNLKNTKNTHGEVLRLVKLQVSK